MEQNHVDKKEDTHQYLKSSGGNVGPLTQKWATWVNFNL